MVITKHVFTLGLVAGVAGFALHTRSVAQAPAFVATPIAGHQTTATVSTVAPDYMEEGIKTKIAKTKADLRTVATGLEAYNIDNNKFPLSGTEGAIRKNAPGESAISSFTSASLTTPIAYLTSMIPDPFAVMEKQTFAYRAVNKTDPEKRGGYIIVSPGPDGKFEVDLNLFDPNDEVQPHPEIRANFYDPSNGTMSSGDIVRSSPFFE